MIVDGCEPAGCAFDFLMRGCPAYLGCLWNVTDIDTDKVTSQMLNFEGVNDLSRLLREAKTMTHYPNLNASSMVVYGLPCRLARN